MDQLSLIRQPIEGDLERYRALFELDFSHQNPLLNLALQHILKRQGKRLRPILTLLSARAIGGVDVAVLHAAVSLEMLHTASLVHDDIVDESDMRRGQKSVNALMSPQAAVLVGDYLLAKSLQHSALTQSTAVVHAIARVAEFLSDGELLQLYTLDSDDISEQAYYDVVRGKTASLFATAAKLGAMLAGAPQQQIDALQAFGESLGICFQIRDDMLDYGDSAVLGKPTGNDMKEGKLTLPVIYAVNNSADEEMRRLALSVRHGEASQEDIDRLVRFTLEAGGLQYAERMMQEFSERAIRQLDALQPSVYVDSLRSFAQLVVKRNS